MPSQLLNFLRVVEEGADIPPRAYNAWRVYSAWIDITIGDAQRMALL